MKHHALTLVIAALLLSACSAGAPAPTETPLPQPSTLTPSETALPSATSTPTQTPTPVPTATDIPTITPTYVDSLRAKVIVDGRLACRFGPGADYLYKFTFAGGSNIEVVGRMEHSHWVLAQAIGGNNRCWVNGGESFLEFTNGDPSTLPPRDPHIVLAWSYIYTYGLSGVNAVRNGDTVTVSWRGIQLNAGDDSEQTPYIVEAWVCQGGDYVFIAVGSWGTSADVIDDGSCGQPAYARVAAAEKHGYTPFVDVPWPQASNK